MSILSEHKGKYWMKGVHFGQYIVATLDADLFPCWGLLFWSVDFS